MWYIILIILTLQLVYARAEMFLCKSQADCQDGFLCSENICKLCLKCEFLFRTGSSCVVDFNQCGECLDGYEQVPITDFSSVLKPCSPSQNATKVTECIDDDNCPPNSYCKEKSCFECFDCSFLNRLPPKGKCAHSKIECGTCAKGYYEVALTTENNFKPCQMETHDFSKISTSKFPIVFSLLLLPILPIVYLAYFVVLYKRHKDQLPSKSWYREKILPSAPPLSSVETPQFVKKHPEDLSLVTFVREFKQKARVFKPPDAPYYYHGEEDNDGENTPLPTGENPVPVLLNPPASAQLLEPQEQNCSGLLSNEYFELGINNDSNASSQAVALDGVDSSQAPDHSTNETVEDVLPVGEEEEREETS